METQRRRRRRSGRKARKRQVMVLVAVAVAIGLAVWTRILILRHDDASVSVPSTASVPVAGPAATLVDRTATKKNLIVFIGTGFGIVPMTATRIAAVGESGTLNIDDLPETALVRTSSRNAQTADAAAAMTAYMTGVKVDNEVLSQTGETRPYDEAGRPQSAHGETACPSVGNGKAVPTLLEMAKRSGRSTGIVTTARITQPILAASYAHLCQRGGENTIAAQMISGGPGSNAALRDGVDVVLGGGWQHFLPRDDPRGSARNDTRDLFAELRAKGYLVIMRKSELVAIQPTASQPVDKVIGLFAPSQLAYDTERPATGEPSLAEMTGRALDLLMRGRDRGYLLIVEGGRIGDALDAALARKAVGEGRAFDEAIGVALKRARQLDPDLRDTTIVVTADHDHALVMNGNATLADRTGEGRPGVLGVLHGYADATQMVADASGRPYTNLAFGAGAKRIRGARSQAPALNDLAMAERDVRYESAVEVAAPLGATDVLLGAAGASAARFHGTLDNTQVFTLLRETMGL